MGDSKSDLIKQVIEALSVDLAVLRKAALETHSSSTDSQSKQEGKYDTQGIEAAYLAGAQAEKVIDLEEHISKLQQISGDDLADAAPVSQGAMIVVSTDEDDLSYMMLPAGGGMSLAYQGLDFIVVTPGSPIGATLLGKHIGDTIELPKHGNSFISDLW
ncbi:MAG: hypothetical protein ABGY95_08700 [Rubritalea sp.]|uniref:hypothetical protein n=1 Tax=Rubritalea sp. TaxID=2109375 RepID=UPI0032421C0D